MKFPLIPVSVCSIALGLLAGYWLGQRGPARDADERGLPPKRWPRSGLAGERLRDRSPAGIIKEMAGGGIWRANEAGLAALARLSAGDFASLAGELRDDLLHPYQKEMREAFFRAWAAKDPAAALAFTEGQASSAMKDEMRIGIMRGWAASDLGGYLGWLEGQPAGPVLDEAVRIAIPQLVALDPGAAIDLTSKLPPHFRSSAYVDIFSSWSLSDPEAATRALEALSLPYRDRSAIQSALAAGWVVSDPAGALAWASSLPAGKQRLDTMQVLAAVWAEKDPEAAIRHASSLAQGEEKR